MLLTPRPELTAPICKLLMSQPSKEDFCHLARYFISLAGKFPQRCNRWGRVFEYWLFYKLSRHAGRYHLAVNKKDPAKMCSRIDFPVFQSIDTFGVSILKNNICLHEVDALIRFKHLTNERHVFIIEARFSRPRTELVEDPYVSLYSLSRIQTILDFLKIRWPDYTFSWGSFIPIDALSESSRSQQDFIRNNGILIPFSLPYQAFKGRLLRKVRQLESLFNRNS